jgi:hypothetical protein
MQSGWILQAQSSLVPDLLPVLTVFTSWRICFRFKNDITLCCVFLYSGRELVSICYLSGNFSVSIDSTGMLIWRQSRFTKMVQGINGHTSFWLTVVQLLYIICGFCASYWCFNARISNIQNFCLLSSSKLIVQFMCPLYLCDMWCNGFFFFICTCSD